MAGTCRAPSGVGARLSGRGPVLVPSGPGYCRARGSFPRANHGDRMPDPPLGADPTPTRVTLSLPMGVTH